MQNYVKSNTLSLTHLYIHIDNLNVDKNCFSILLNNLYALPPRTVTIKNFYFFFIFLLNILFFMVFL